MDDKRKELLEYISRIYDREGSKASKEGMTFWAIVAGLVFVIARLLQTLSGFTTGDLDYSEFYKSFSQLHLAILSIYVLTLIGGFSQRRRLDYRLLGTRNIGPIFIIAVIFISAPLFASYQLRGIENPSPFQFQDTINFWTLAILALVLLISVIYVIGIEIRTRKATLPPIEQLVTVKPAITKAISVLMALLLLELVCGNAFNIFSRVYGSEEVAIVQSVAFDISIIMFGAAVLFKNSRTAERLNGLARIERDILLHDLSEREIIDRLQEDYLGEYLGDRIRKCLLELREKRKSVLDSLSKFEKIRDTEIAETGDAEVDFSDYIQAIKKEKNSYFDSNHLVLTWFRQALMVSISHQDRVMIQILDECIDILEDDIDKFDKDLEKHLNIINRSREGDYRQSD